MRSLIMFLSLSCYISVVSCIGRPVLTFKDNRYQRQLAARQLEVQGLCDTLVVYMKQRDTTAYGKTQKYDYLRMGYDGLTDTIFRQRVTEWGWLITHNKADSVLTLCQDELGWNSGLRYDYSTAGNKLSPERYYRFRLKRVNSRLFYQQQFKSVLELLY